MIQKKREKRWAAFVFGLFILNYPILDIFNKKIFLAGVPVLFLYLFVIWIVLIGMVLHLTRKD